MRAAASMEHDGVDFSMPTSREAVMNKTDGVDFSLPSATSGKSPQRNNASQYQEILDVEAEMDTVRKQKRKRFKGRFVRVFQKVCILFCVYMLFLISGVAVTQYTYNPLTGELTAQRMSVEELNDQGEFRRLHAFYIRARNLYEDVLALDYRLANNPDRALLIASEYEFLLDDVSRLVVDINASSFSPKYNQLYRQLLQWVQTDVAVYIQNVSMAVANNDEERAMNAMFAREVVYNNFLMITENLETFGRGIKGVELGDIYEWSPERYLADLGGFSYE
jgi:hypothetical protein